MTRAWTRSCVACSVRKGLIFLMLCSANLQDRAVFAMCSWKSAGHWRLHQDVCGEKEGSKNRALGNTSDQLMCFGYLPSPGHPERPTSEIGFKPEKLNPSDVQWWEGGQEDLMIDSVKSGRQIQQNEDWWFGVGFCNSQSFSDWE